MTTAALLPSKEHIENGVTVAFAVPFRFGSGNDLKVKRISAAGVVTPLVINVDYTVTGGATDAGGTLTVTTPAAAGVRLLIERVTPRNQGTQYPTNDTFPAASHEAALDRAMMIDQEQDVAIGALAKRSVLVSEGQIAPALGAISDGQVLGMVAGQLVGVPSDAADVADLTAQAGASAGVAIEQAGIATAKAAETDADRIAAEAAAANAAAAANYGTRYAVADLADASSVTATLNESLTVWNDATTANRGIYRCTTAPSTFTKLADLPTTTAAARAITCRIRMQRSRSQRPTRQTRQRHRSSPRQMRARARKLSNRRRRPTRNPLQVSNVL